MMTARCTIYNHLKEGAEKAQRMVEGLIEEAVVGKTYTGPVKRIMDFGAFVEILPGKEGLVHISKLAATRVENVNDVVKEGQVLTVTVTEIDHMGRINLATKEALDANPGLLTEHAERRPAASRRGQAPQRRLPGRTRGGGFADGPRTRRRAAQRAATPAERWVILTERLANGATLLLEPVDRTDTLCIGFWFLHGSRDEGPGRRGYSHFLEHMLFKGTARRTALAIAQEIDRVGGIINAFTEKETTCVYAIIPKEHLRLAFDVLTDMTVGSLLDQGEMEKEKAVIVNEIRSVDDSPEEKGHDRYLREMWGDHPLARKITGEVEEVQGVRGRTWCASPRRGSSRRTR